MCNWWKTCKQQIQAHAPNGPHTNVQLQLKLCQQEMLFPVTESSFAQFTLFPVKRNKHSFDLRLYLSYKFRLRGGRGNFYKSDSGQCVIFHSSSHLREAGKVTVQRVFASVRSNDHIKIKLRDRVAGGPDLGSPPGTWERTQPSSVGSLNLR